MGKQPKLSTEPPRGMRDILPDEAELRDWMGATILATYRRYGFRRVETPALENGHLEQSLAELSRLKEELRFQAYHDPLTGLANRTLFLDRVEARLGRSADGWPVVLFLDLDDFKIVNDTHGHEMGDAVLAAIGRRLSGVARTTDVVVRLGGDEFVIVCVDAGPAEAAAVAGRALAAITEPIIVRDVEIRVHASAGVVAAERGAAASELLDAADAAMYRAKRGGGGRVSA